MTSSFSSPFFRRLLLVLLLGVGLLCVAVGIWGGLRIAAIEGDHLNEIILLCCGIGVIALAGAVAAFVVAASFARQHAAPLRELEAFANTIIASRSDNPGANGNGHAPLGFGKLPPPLDTVAESLDRLITGATAETERLSTILASMSEGVIATDRQQRILLTNKAAATLLVFDAKTAAGKLLWEVIRNESILKSASEVLASGHRKTFGIGPVAGRHLEITASTFPAQKKPDGVILVAHDTTQSVQYQDLRKEFVANVSHELRTPLSIIKGFAETLRDGALTDPVRGPQYLATIEKHTDQLTNLVDDLLELSRLDSQYGLSRRLPIDVAALIRRSCDLLMPAAQRKKHQLVQDIAGDLPALIGTPDYIERAITNLVDNAIKYTPEKGLITIAARAEEEQLVIEVSDNGIGIAPDDVPRIFERFYRVDRSRSRELGGTGLGLSIVKHVAQVHGGTVEVTADPGHGSKFRLKLPLPEGIIGKLEERSR